MDYEKKYKEALALARSYYDKDSMNAFLDTIFPELRESEDERIRKEIIDYLNSRVATAEETELLYFKRWIAYLEKQKEQKPVLSLEEKEYVRQLKALVSDFVRDKKPKDVEFYQQIWNWLDGLSGELMPIESD